jgi:hypothetical protein
MRTRLLSTRNAMASGIALALGCAFVTATQAAVIIPEKSGFSGYVNLGAGGVSVKSNMMASIINGKVDVGDKTIKNLADSPNSSEGGAIPALNFELSYTFGSTRTQLYLGNLLENYLSMEMNTLAGIRQDIGNAGNIGAAFTTTSVDTQVWSDPYLTDAKRKDTDRTAQGFNVYWQQIMRSGLELKYSLNDIDIDKERSGESLALSTAQRKLLDRNGDVYRYTMSYEFASDDKRHIVTPAIAYVDRDLDGEAMANDGGVVSLNYIYQYNNHWSYVVNASYGDFDYKESNPIYGKEDSANSYGISGTVFYKEPFGWKDWSFNATAGYYEEDNDIDFYDTEVGVVVFAMLRRF